MLLNLFFYQLNRSEPTHESQRMKLRDVIAACNQLNVNAWTLLTVFSYNLDFQTFQDYMNMWKGHLIFGESYRSYLIESKFLVAGNYNFSCNAL